MKPPHQKPLPERELSRGRLWLFRITAMLLPLLLLGAVELALRLAGCGHDPDFFRPLRIGGEDYFVQNDDFSLSFFPKETLRQPGPVRMLARKPPGTYRVFVLGESAAMGDPEPAYGAYRYLEALLRDRFPGEKFEIINVAFTAINSHVILPIARECARHEGDLWIIYMGNNEMVGPFGAATVFGKPAPPLLYVRLITALQRTRVGQLLLELASRAQHRAAPAASWGGMQMFLEHRVAPDSLPREAVYRNFQRNLDDIVRAGLGSGSKVLLNTVTVNLKDCPPFASLATTPLAAAERAQFDRLLAGARERERAGDFAAAAQHYEQAAKLDGKFAELQFLWGQCLLRLSSREAARQHLQLACDDDALPFRTDSRLNGIIEQVPGRFHHPNLALCRADQLLSQSADAGICGQETFYEHVHFDFDGSYRLGRVWAQQIEPLLPPAISRGTNGWASQEKCEQLLGLSDWNRALVLEHMTGRFEQPPLSSQANNSGRLEALRARVKELRGKMNAAGAAAARTNFLHQLALAPDDYLLRENFAAFLQSTGDLRGATDAWRRIHEMLPHDYLAYFQLGRLLGSQKQWEEAEASLRRALRIRPTLTEGWAELGNVLAAQEKFAPALASYQVARQQAPHNPQTLFRLGKVFAALHRHAEAVQFYREAIQANPASWEFHYELAGELDAAGELDGARNEFAEAAKLNPDYSRAHFNYGVLLAKQGRLEAAQKQFEEALRLEPQYQKARDYLAQVQDLKKRAP